MRRPLLLAALTFLLAWLLLVAGQLPLSQRRDVERPAEALVTWSEFMTLRQGMNYEECIRVIGAPGVPFGSSAEPASVREWPEWLSFVWRNDAESFAQVSFHYGRAERLSASNLP